MIAADDPLRGSGKTGTAAGKETKEAAAANNRAEEGAAAADDETEEEGDAVTDEKPVMGTQADQDPVKDAAEENEPQTRELLEVSGPK